jgi:ferritin-like metal-binding protein YciE
MFVAKVALYNIGNNGLIHREGGMYRLEALKDLFVIRLKEIYSAEMQITRVLPKLAGNASSPVLRDVLTEQLNRSRDHVLRVEMILDAIGDLLRPRKCRAVEGILTDGEESMLDEKEPEAIDAALIVASRQLNHHGIASYGVAKTYAKALGYNDEALLLQEILGEEERTDRTLTVLAEKALDRSTIPDKTYGSPVLP